MQNQRPPEVQSSIEPLKTEIEPVLEQLDAAHQTKAAPTIATKAHTLETATTPSQANAQTLIQTRDQANAQITGQSAPQDKSPERTISPREMAEKIDKSSKYVPIQLLEASFERGVNMPKGLFIVMDAQEAYELVKTGKATLFNQN